MQADGNAEDGRAGEAEGDEADDAPSASSESEPDEETPPDAGFWINPAIFRIAADVEHAQHRFEPISPKLIETIRSLWSAGLGAVRGSEGTQGVCRPPDNRTRYRGSPQPGRVCGLRSPISRG